MILFNKRIQELRYSRNWTQKFLASRLGVSPSMIAHYETAERFPSLDVLIRTARVFHVTTDCLLGLDQTDHQTLDISGLSANEIRSLDLVIENYRNK